MHFQAAPVDVYTAVAYSVVVSGILLSTGAGTPLALVLVVFVPGYLATAAILPRKEEADWTLRIALSFGLSLAIVAFTGIALNYSPWGINPWTIITSLLVLTAILGALAYRRRMRLRPSERLEGTIEVTWIRWRQYSLLEKIISVVLAVALVTGIPLLAFSLAQPRPTQPFSELYLLGPTGNFTGYPSHLNVSSPGTLLIVVTNHEGALKNYTIRVDLVQLGTRYNSTTKQNETVEVNRSTIKSFARDLVDSGSWIQPFTFSIPTAGSWALDFLLSMRGSVVNPYRETRFLVTVK